MLDRRLAVTPRQILTGVVLIALVAAVVTIWRVASAAGAHRVEARVERDHGARVAEARTDERAAGDVAAAIATRVSRADDLSTEAVKATIKDLRDAIDAVPPAAAGDPLPAAPVDELREHLNAGIARANRAGEAAGAPG